MTRARLERTITLLTDASLPAVMGGAAITDASGNLSPPGDETVIVDLITETRARATLATPVIDTTVQVTCLALTPARALELLEQARLALPFPEYDPGVTGPTGRLPTPTRSWFGVFQRFTIHLSPADTLGS